MGKLTLLSNGYLKISNRVKLLGRVVQVLVDYFQPKQISVIAALIYTHTRFSSFTRLLGFLLIQMPSKLFFYPIVFDVFVSI